MMILREKKREKQWKWILTSQKRTMSGKSGKKGIFVRPRVIIYIKDGVEAG